MLNIEMNIKTTTQNYQGRPKLRLLYTSIFRKNDCTTQFKFYGHSFYFNGQLDMYMHASYLYTMLHKHFTNEKNTKYKIYENNVFFQAINHEEF